MSHPSTSTATATSTSSRTTPIETLRNVTGSEESFSLGCADFVRGDANADGGVSLADIVTITRFQHLLLCRDAGDANDDEVADLCDASFIARTLFLGDTEIPRRTRPRSGSDDCAAVERSFSGLGCGEISPSARAGCSEYAVAGARRSGRHRDHRRRLRLARRGGLDPDPRERVRAGRGHSSSSSSTTRRSSISGGRSPSGASGPSTSRDPSTASSRPMPRMGPPEPLSLPRRPGAGAHLPGDRRLVLARRVHISSRGGDPARVHARGRVGGRRAGDAHLDRARGRFGRGRRRAAPPPERARPPGRRPVRERPPRDPERDSPDRGRPSPTSSAGTRTATGRWTSPTR